MKLSNRAKRLTGQGMFQIKAKTKDKDLIHFEIGDSCFDAPKRVKQACIKAIKNNKTHYTDPLGLPELRKAIADKYKVNVENIAVVPANYAIYASLSILCNKGEKVNYPIPGFPTYRAVCDYLGLKRGDGDVVICNSPNNPTGQVKGISTDKWLIKDCAYEDMYYEGDAEIYRYNPNKIIEIHSFSKNHSMPGFRLGFMIAPKEIIDKVGLLVETTYSCLPEFIQWAGIEALKTKGYKMKELKKRRDMMYKVLSKYYQLKKPQGAIYCWCKCKDGDKEFEWLLKQKIVVCPGSVFDKKDYVRFCFAKSINDIKKLERILAKCKIKK